jgi:hypothetical protein
MCPRRLHLAVALLYALDNILLFLQTSQQGDLLDAVLFSKFLVFRLGFGVLLLLRVCLSSLLRIILRIVLGILLVVLAVWLLVVLIGCFGVILATTRSIRVVVSPTMEIASLPFMLLFLLLFLLLLLLFLLLFLFLLFLAF